MQKCDIKNVNQLKKKLLIEWNNITSDITEKLIKSMLNRLIEVTSHKGHQTKY